MTAVAFIIVGGVIGISLALTLPSRQGAEEDDVAARDLRAGRAVIGIIAASFVGFVLALAFESVLGAVARAVALIFFGVILVSIMLVPWLNYRRRRHRQRR